MKNEMRILQIIDSLNAGGAERMVVNYANLLQEQGMQSFLCCTREEGILKKEISEKVGYIFLNKHFTLDLKAILKLRKFIKENQINILHAHTTSFFTASIQKLINPNVKLIWHDHNGKRAMEERKSNVSLIACSKFFDAVITVNPQLKVWASRYLAVSNINYLPNFVKWKNVFEVKEKTKQNSVQLVCLANLRKPKNHMNLLIAFSEVQKRFPDIILHLVGRDFEDEYSNQLKDFSKSKKIQDKIVFYGAQSGTAEILGKMDMGILSSDSEGLPMSLLEYGMAGLAVIVTDVGECSKVVQNFGKVVEPNKPQSLTTAMMEYLEAPETMRKDAARFQQHVYHNFTDKTVFNKIFKIYQAL